MFPIFITGLCFTGRKLAFLSPQPVFGQFQALPRFFKPVSRCLFLLAGAFKQVFAVLYFFTSLAVFVLCSGDLFAT